MTEKMMGTVVASDTEEAAAALYVQALSGGQAYSLDLVNDETGVFTSHSGSTVLFSPLTGKATPKEMENASSVSSSAADADASSDEVQAFTATCGCCSMVSTTRSEERR